MGLIDSKLAELKEQGEKQLSREYPSEFALKNHSLGPWKHCSASKGQCQCRTVWSIPNDAPVTTAKAVACVHHEWGDGPDMIYGEVPEDQVRANAELISFAWKIPLWLEEIKRLKSLVGER